MGMQFRAGRTPGPRAEENREVNTRRDTTKPGFTMVELLVVMAVLAVLAIMAVPTFSRFGMFSQDDLQNTARTLHSLLRMAQIHATTYHVNTAVVYMLDNYRDPETDPDNTPGLAAPVIDSITGENVRVIVGAAVMYQPAAGHAGSCQECFVPVESAEGSFTFFPESTVVLLRDAAILANGNPLIVYGDRHTAPEDRRPRFNCEENSVQDPSNGMWHSGLSYLGMQDVQAIVAGPPVDPGAEGEEIPVISSFPAHVFTPSGHLDVQTNCSGSCSGYQCVKTKERYVMLVAPSPSSAPEARLIQTEKPRMIILETNDKGVNESVSNLVSIPIELFRASGRVRIAS